MERTETMAIKRIITGALLVLLIVVGLAIGLKSTRAVAEPSIRVMAHPVDSSHQAVEVSKDQLRYDGR